MTNINSANQKLVFLSFFDVSVDSIRMSKTRKFILFDIEAKSGVHDVNELQNNIQNLHLVIY
jgi:hypothetical protein